MYQLKTLGNTGTSNIFIQMGVSLIIIGLVLACFFFYPIFYLESKFILLTGDPKAEVVLQDYRTAQQKIGQSQTIIAADKNFSIVIPKLGANSKVIANVDPFEPLTYQNALTLGVAHAKGTAFPGQIGNTFLFSHSSVNFYEATKYNADFYLLNKLKKDDIFYLVYDYKIFKYKVTSSTIVDATDVKYLDNSVQGKTATLMTCWPAGTSLKRLLVQGELVEVK